MKLWSTSGNYTLFTVVIIFPSFTFIDFDEVSLKKAVPLRRPILFEPIRADKSLNKYEKILWFFFRRVRSLFKGFKNVMLILEDQKETAWNLSDAKRKRKFCENQKNSSKNLPTQKNKTCLYFKPKKTRTSNPV